MAKRITLTVSLSYSNDDHKTILDAVEYWQGEGYSNTEILVHALAALAEQDAPKPKENLNTITRKLESIEDILRGMKMVQASPALAQPPQQKPAATINPALMANMADRFKSSNQ